VPKFQIFFIALGSLSVVSCAVIVGGVGYRFLQQRSQPVINVSAVPLAEQAIISGSVQYNGIQPMTDTTQIGKVILYQRGLGEHEFHALPIVVPVVTAATWSWNGAELGKTYEVQAAVQLGGREIAHSNTIVVTAPAGGEQLIFNVSDDQVPKEVLPTPQLIVLANGPVSTVSSFAQTTPFGESNSRPVSLSGRVNVSGYLPPAARFVLNVAPETSETFQAVTNDIELKDGAVWIWPNAEVGKKYKVVLELLLKDVILGKSDPVVVAAPATNQYLQLASTARPPVQTMADRAAIVGTIDLNGPVANNSSVLILQRKPGESSYQAVARIPAADGQSWSFDQASSSVQYEMTAALQVNEQNTSSANAATLTAPATQVVFRINTNFSLDAPGLPRLLTCGSRQSDGKWPAEIVFDQISNANFYWLQLGTVAGKNDTHNEKRSRSKSNEEKITIALEDKKEYFVRYAQAQCTDCRSDQDYSGFSDSQRVVCGN